jgi:hypothetical protein
MTLYILAFICIVSILFNAYFIHKELKRKPKNKEQRIKEDMQLLQDLMSNGRTLVEIKRIAPSDYFIRSPRDYR